MKGLESNPESLLAELSPLRATPEVRGHQAYSRPASSAVWLAARVADLSLVAALWGAWLCLRSRPIAPERSWLLIYAASAAAYFLLSSLALKRSPGDALWRLARDPSSARLLQYSKLEAQTAVPAGFLTLLLIGSASYFAGRASWAHPLWSRAEALALEPFQPPADGKGPVEWAIHSFFYTLGAWPSSIEGAPVFYSIPYEKGPPERFVGKVQALWDSPQIRLTIEGPKTPPAAPHPDDLKRCIRDSSRLPCLRSREASLFRHLDEMARFSPGSWELRWFEVSGPARPVSGIFLSATNRSRSIGQDRYIVVSPGGAHQSFILDFPLNDAGARARETLRNAVRSLRSNSTLSEGRLWADRRLEATKLSELDSNSAPELYARRLADIQALLISKITVDPGVFDSYFHWGGLALTLARHSRKNPSEPRSSDWSAAARASLESATRFAQDVHAAGVPGAKGAEPRLESLRSYLKEIHKP